MSNGFYKKLIYVIIFSTVLYMALTIYADFDKVITSLSSFNLLLIPLLAILVLINYFLRFLKWHYYLNRLNISVPFATSFKIFMSGLSMSATPGKMGELLKSVLLKKTNNVNINKSAPVVLVERITDLTAMLLLAALGAVYYSYGNYILYLFAALLLGTVFIIGNKKIVFLIIELFGKIPLLKRYTNQIEELYKSAYILLKPVPFVLMSMLSTCAWFFECIVFYIITSNLGIDAHFLLVTFIYAFSTIAGSVSMLPGGIGVMEGAISFLMIERGIDKSLAISSIFIFRSVSLWFAVFVGILFLSLFQKQIGKIEINQKKNIKE